LVSQRRPMGRRSCVDKHAAGKCRPHIPGEGSQRYRNSIFHQYPTSQRRTFRNPPFPSHQRRWPNRQHPNHITHKPTSLVAVIGLHCSTTHLVYYTKLLFVDKRIHSSGPIYYNTHHTHIPHLKIHSAFLKVSSCLSSAVSMQMISTQRRFQQAG